MCEFVHIFSRQAHSYFRHVPNIFNFHRHDPVMSIHIPVISKQEPGICRQYEDRGRNVPEMLRTLKTHPNISSHTKDRLKSPWAI